MIKKLASIIGFTVVIGCIIVMINPNFKFAVLFNRIEAFPNHLPTLNDVNFVDVYHIYVPNIAGFRELARGINRILDYIFLFVEYDLLLIRHLFDFTISVLNLLKYIFLGY